MGRVHQRIVNDLQIDGLSLVIGTREGSVFAIDQQIVADDRFSLYLHHAIEAAVADIAFDHILPLAARAVDGDTGIVAIVDRVLSDQVAPRTLLDLDAISLASTTVVNVIHRYDALAHDHVAIIAAKIHPFGGTISIVNSISG